MYHTQVPEHFTFSEITFIRELLVPSTYRAELSATQAKCIQEVYIQTNIAYNEIAWYKNLHDIYSLLPQYTTPYSFSQIDVGDTVVDMDAIYHYISYCGTVTRRLASGMAGYTFYAMPTELFEHELKRIITAGEKLIVACNCVDWHYLYTMCVVNKGV